MGNKDTWGSLSLLCYGHTTDFLWTRSKLEFHQEGTTFKFKTDPSNSSDSYLPWSGSRQQHQQPERTLLLHCSWNRWAPLSDNSNRDKDLLSFPALIAAWSPWLQTSPWSSQRQQKHLTTGSWAYPPANLDFHRQYCNHMKNTSPDLLSVQVPCKAKNQVTSHRPVNPHSLSPSHLPRTFVPVLGANSSSSRKNKWGGGCLHLRKLYSCWLQWHVLKIPCCARDRNWLGAIDISLLLQKSIFILELLRRESVLQHGRGKPFHNVSWDFSGRGSRGHA